MNSYAISQMGSQLGSSAQSSAGASAGALGSAGDARLKEQAATDLGYRELGGSMSVPNWNALADKKVQDTMTSSIGAGSLKDVYGGSNSAVANANALTNSVSAVGANSGARGKLDAAGGDIGKFAQQSYNYGVTDWHTKAGANHATNEEASALGMSVSDATAFKQTGNVLDQKTTDSWNERFNTDVFKGGQQISYGVDNDKLNNVSIRDNADNAQVGKYTVKGSKETILGDDMQALKTNYSGLISEDGKTYEGGLSVDENGKVVNMTGQEGRQTTSNATHNTNIGETVHFADGIKEEMLRGDGNTWQNHENNFGRNDGVSEANISELASYFSSNMMSKDATSQSALRAGIGVGFLKSLGITNEAYMQADDNQRANMINASFQSKHDEISNNDSLTNEQKANARAEFHEKLFNEYLDMVDDSKAERMVDQGIKEGKGAIKIIKEQIGDGNPMGMEDEDGKNWGS